MNSAVFRGLAALVGSGAIVAASAAACFAVGGSADTRAASDNGGIRLAQAPGAGSGRDAKSSPRDSDAVREKKAEPKAGNTSSDRDGPIKGDGKSDKKKD